MPHYFFHTRYKHFMKDDDGVSLPDIATAWKQATRTTGHILRDLDGSLEPGREWRMEVTNADGKVLFALRFSAEFYDD